MTNIREYVKKKEKKQGESIGKKILRHRLVIFYRFVLVAGLLAAVTAVIVIQMKNRVYDTYQVTATAPRESLTDATCTRFGDKLLLYSSDGASCMDKKGAVQWNQTFEMQNPIIDMCQNVVALGDYNGSKIYVMDTQKPMGEIDTKMPIRSFSVSSAGVVAAVLDDSAVTWIYLFDSSGNTLAYFKTTMKQSGYPVCVSISDNGNLVGVSYLYVDSGAMKSSVAFYNFGPVGQNEIDNFVSSYDYVDTVVPFLEFLNNEEAVAVADNRLVIYRGEQKPVSVADVLLSEEITSVYYGSSYIGLVYPDVTGAALYKVDVYNNEGKLVDSKQLDMEFTDMIFHKDRMIVYNEKECLIHNIGGDDSFKGQFEKGVLAMIPTSSSYEYVIITSDSIDTIELK